MKKVYSVTSTKKKSFHWQREFNKILSTWLVGVDIISHNEKVHQYIKDNYPLRILQLFHHNIKMTDFMVESAKREHVIEEEKKRIDNFFAIHDDQEIMHVEIYHTLSSQDTKSKCMPTLLQIKFKHFLETQRCH